jgi:hypothetical protein
MCLYGVILHSASERWGGGGGGEGGTLRKKPTAPHSDRAECGCPCGDNHPAPSPVEFDMSFGPGIERAGSYMGTSCAMLWFLLTRRRAAYAACRCLSRARSLAINKGKWPTDHKLISIINQADYLQILH